MESSAATFEFVAVATARLASQLRSDFELDAARPEGRGTAFQSLARVLLGALDSEVEADRARFSAARAVDRSDLVRRMRLLNHFGRLIHSASPWLEYARLSDVRRASPLGLSTDYLLDEFVEALLESSGDAALIAANEYTYAVIHRPLEEIPAQLGALYPEGPSPLVIYYPTHDAQTSSLHSLLTHEVAHAPCRESELVARVLDASTSLDAVAACLIDAAAELGKSKAVDEQDAMLDVRSVFRNWLEELLCDALATTLLGPNFVLAFVAFVYPITADEPSQGQPPGGSSNTQNAVRGEEACR